MEKVYSFLNSLLNDGKIRAIGINDKIPHGFYFLSGNGTAGEVKYLGKNYVYAVVDNKLRVMTSAQAGWNWSETIYK